MTKLKFHGTLHLKSLIVSDGSHYIYPFGRHVKGLLIYMPNDYMAVQIMMPKHYPIQEKEKQKFDLEELAQTLKSIGHLAYYGKYEVDTHRRRVIHLVEGSIAQPIAGKAEVRQYSFIGDKLILSRGNMDLTWTKI